MDKWNLIVDVAKCENCSNCVIAVNDEHCGNSYPGYSAPQPLHGQQWIQIQRRVRGEAPMVDAAYLPTTCNHCEEAPCVAASRNGAVYRRPDGIVIIDPQKAKGNREIVDSCPYGAIWWNEKEQVAQKWIFEAHLLDQGWKEPRCVQACPTGALRSLKASDERMLQIVREEKLEVLRPELGTKPRVYYRNLYRFQRCFIGGTVVAQVGGVLDCVEAAQVTLSSKGRKLAQMQTDGFGDFKFDDLEAGSGSYQVEVVHPQFGSRKLETDLGESRYLGTVRMATVAGA